MLKDYESILWKPEDIFLDGLFLGASVNERREEPLNIIMRDWEKKFKERQCKTALAYIMNNKYVDSILVLPTLVVRSLREKRQKLSPRKQIWLKERAFRLSGITHQIESPLAFIA